MADDENAARVQKALAARFGEQISVDPALGGLDELARIAAHRVHRRYAEKPIGPDLLRLLCACALSAPSKSDLQQGDIVVVRDRGAIEAVAALIPDMPWIAAAPVFLVFVANGRRLKRLFDLRRREFPNDHLDQFFNAVSDASIVLSTFIRAAEAVGLGCCPISVIRDHAEAVSRLFDLPDRVIPLAGMTVGWPAEEGAITPRLGLDTTVHDERFDDADLPHQLERYDRRRHAVRPFARQRDPQQWGVAAFYGWSEDKARQYGVTQRADFGGFVRRKGFRLD